MSRAKSTPSFIGAFLFLAVTCLSQPGITWAGSPIEALQVTSQHAHTILADAELNKPEHRVKRTRELIRIIGDRFDGEEMSQRVLGDEWTKHTEAEQEEFLRLFEALLVKSYISKIEGYAAAPILYLGERIGNGHAVVTARIYGVKTDYLVDFWLVDKTGDWLVYDVVVDGASLITSYNRQFARVLTYSSYETLIERMREKAAQPVQTR